MARSQPSPVSPLTAFTTDGLGNIYTLSDTSVAMWRLKALLSEA